MAKCSDFGGTRKNGLPCGRPVPVGLTRCNLHGGANPAAKIKAEQMLAQARLPACEALFTIIDQWSEDTCSTCGFPKQGDVDTTKMIIRASQVILDRTGVGPRSTIETVPQKDGDLDFDLLTEDEMARLDFLLTELKEFKTQVRARIARVVAGELTPAVSDTPVTH